MPTFTQCGSSTYEEGLPSIPVPPTPLSPHHDTTDPFMASLQSSYIWMYGYEERFDQIKAHQSRFDLFKVDYQSSQYPLYDHHYW